MVFSVSLKSLVTQLLLSFNFDSLINCQILHLAVCYDQGFGKVVVKTTGCQIKLYKCFIFLFLHTYGVYYPIEALRYPSSFDSL
jgi:hypothetical protein